MQRKVLSLFLVLTPLCFASRTVDTWQTPRDRYHIPLLAQTPAPKPLQVPKRPPSPEPPYQDVFQVHPPVLTPAGHFAASRKTPEDGSKSGNEQICTELLMDHSFGFSYGHPFIGWVPLCVTAMQQLTCCRELYSAKLHFQPGRSQSDRGLQRTAIRPACFVVFG